MYPEVGEAVEIVKGVMGLSEGKYSEAAISLVEAIPFLGDLAGPLADLLKKLPDGTLKKIMELVEKFLKLCKTANYKLEKIINGATCLIEDIFDEFLKGAKKVLSGGELFDGKKIDEIFDAIKDFFKQKHCFVGGTLVNTSIGLVEIEKIREGDLVYSKDEETGEEGLKRVTGTSEKEVYITYEIEFEKEVIMTTEEHPFWVYGKDFVEASKLVEGDEIVVGQDSEEYKLEEIKSIKRHLHEEAIKVYNFVVEDWHTYFIGESRFWVHNKGCETPDLDDGKFPNNPDDLFPEIERPTITKSNGTVSQTIIVNDTIRIRAETHPLQTGEIYTPRHHGQHYHVEQRADPNKSWNNKGNVSKVLPPEYTPGSGTGFVPGESIPNLCNFEGE